MSRSGASATTVAVSTAGFAAVGTVDATVSVAGFTTASVTARGLGCLLHGGLPGVGDRSAGRLHRIPGGRGELGGRRRLGDRLGVRVDDLRGHAVDGAGQRGRDTCGRTLRRVARGLLDVRCCLRRRGLGLAGGLAFAGSVLTALAYGSGFEVSDVESWCALRRLGLRGLRVGRGLALRGLLGLRPRPWARRRRPCRTWRSSPSRPWACRPGRPNPCRSRTSCSWTRSWTFRPWTCRPTTCRSWIVPSDRRLVAVRTAGLVAVRAAGLLTRRLVRPTAVRRALVLPRHRRHEVADRTRGRRARPRRGCEQRGGEEEAAQEGGEHESSAHRGQEPRPPRHVDGRHPLATHQSPVRVPGCR